MSFARIGTVDIPGRLERERYFRELDYLELSALFAGPLKPSVLDRWAKIVPARQVGLVAPFPFTHRKPPTGTKLWPYDASTGDFRDSSVSRGLLPGVRAAAEQLAAGSIVFRSPDTFSASAANRDVLRRFFLEIATPETLGDARRVWIPGGLWEVGPALKLAAELGVTCGFDPLVREPGEPPEIYYDLELQSPYFRIEGTRAGTLRGDRLDDLVALVENYAETDVTIAFATAERWNDAKNLKKLLAEAS